MRQPSLGDGPQCLRNDLAVRVSAFQRSEALSESAEPAETFAGDLQLPGGDPLVVAPTARTGYSLCPVMADNGAGDPVAPRR
ncbi:MULTISPECIES: hypothetical protein [unclassified Streptomyces]|uniref:hypothetical protein n=1 Tax=unclassified Streptomyces TaxID=2593676 RepID=UPI002FF1AFB5